MAYGMYQASRAFKFARITSGDFTFTSTTFVDLSSAVDLTLAAQVSDVIEVGMAFTTMNSGGSNLNAFDVQTRVSSAGVNYISGGLTDGVAGWRAQNPTAANLMAITGSYFYTVTAGDLSGGTITLRPRGRVNAGTATVSADGTQRAFFWFARNLGPMDPN